MLDAGGSASFEAGGLDGVVLDAGLAEEPAAGWVV
jgi:hypothetical protein